MTAQASLFDAPTARASDPVTSHIAAQNAAPRAEKHRDIALRCLRRAGPNGLSDFELEKQTGISQTSIGKRRLELVRAGLVEKTAMRRPSPSGSPAIVWRAVS